MRLGIAILLVLTGCTVIPKVVKNSQGSLDGNAQNSGLIGYDAAGNGILTSHARDRYNGLVKAYGARFSPPLLEDSGLVATSTNTWLMDGQHRFYFETMNRWHKQRAPIWGK